MDFVPRFDDNKRRHPLLPEQRAEMHAHLSEAITKNPIFVFENADEDIRHDRQRVVEAMESYAALKPRYHLSLLRHVPEVYRDDLNIVLMACRAHGSEYEHASKRVRRNRDVILAAFSSGSAHIFDFVPRDMQAQVSEDRELMLAAVASFGLTLFHASPTLKDDRELVKVAVTDSCDSLGYASWRLRQDKDLALYAARQQTDNGDSPLGHLSQELREDRGVVAAFCNNISQSLEFAPAFQDDRELVMLAIQDRKSVV